MIRVIFSVLPFSNFTTPQLGFKVLFFKRSFTLQFSLWLKIVELSFYAPKKSEKRFK